ncbi:MAG: hypothetical protein QOI41_5178 [Myxococcales bacterium]|jgi:hypothetical protein|nr:hypothetical protein [Myxococcales bacterium]
MRSTHIVSAALLFSCGAGAASCGAGGAGDPPSTPGRPVQPGAPSPAISAAAPSRCPGALDARDLLARHARGYGSQDAVAASLPVVMTGTMTVENRVGKVEVVVTRDAVRSQAWIAGLVAANGLDAAGAWTLEGGTGIVERQRANEGIESALDAWLLRRSYVVAFDPARDTARCEDVGAAASGGARVDLAFARPELGSPVLSFDLESGALLSTAHEQADGVATRTTYEAWSEASPAHVRWPRKTTQHPVVGDASTQEYAAIAAGLTCARFDASGVAIPVRGDACAAPLADRFVARWPAGDRPRIRLPLTYLGSELLVRAKIGGRDAMAFLDSGAGVTAVDATTPAGTEFHPSMEVTGSGATQKVKLGFGELASIDLGELHVEHVPTASVPIPALDAFGDKRPELILGYSFFVTAVVRVDYKRSEVVLAKSTDGLFAKGVDPRSVPLRILRSKVIVDGTVERTPAPFEVDTGNAGGLDLYKKWASAHGLPGDRPVVTLNGRFGVGTGETASMFYRLGNATLGPIAFDGHLAHVADPPAIGIVAGLAGNEVLARCDAVIFDVPKRTLWLEGACDRPVPERRAGWRFDKKIDAAFPDRPWVVTSLWPGGAAERAGVQVGDRVLEMGGKPATIDIAPIWAIEQQPAGTKVPIVVVHASAPKDRVRLIIELRSPTP